ncbi:hypothetical protein BO219_11490, partial [Anoxybacillus kestanbolensis]
RLAFISSLFFRHVHRLLPVFCMDIFFPIYTCLLLKAHSTVTPRRLSKIDRDRGSLDDPLFFVATVVEIARGIEKCYNLHSNYISRVGG